MAASPSTKKKTSVSAVNEKCLSKQAFRRNNALVKSHSFHGSDRDKVKPTKDRCSDTNSYHGRHSDHDGAIWLPNTDTDRRYRRKTTSGNYGNEHLGRDKVDYAVPEVPLLSRDMLVCPSCRLRFAEPLVLPCGHTLCAACIHQIDLSAGECPVNMGHNNNPPVENIDALPSNTVASVFTQQNSEGNGPKKCPSCGQYAVGLRQCLNHCNRFVCVRCLYKHDDEVITNLRTTMSEIRRRVTALTEQRIHWEGQLENLCTQYEDAKLTLDRNFTEAKLSLERKHQERCGRLEDFVKPYMTRIKGDIRHVIKLTGNADSLLSEMRRLSSTGKDLSQLTVLRLRLRCLAVLAAFNSSPATSVVENEYYRPDCFIRSIAINDNRERYTKMLDACYQNNMRITFE